MRVVFFGDSLTEGRPGAAYLRLLEADARADPRLAAVELVNAGVGGDTVFDLLARVDRDVVARSPGAVVVFVGMNEMQTMRLWRSLPTPSTLRALYYFRRRKGLRHPITPARYEEGLRRLVDVLAERTSARLALCTPPTRREDRDRRDRALLDAYAGIVRGVAAERGCDLIDVRAAFVRALSLPERRGPRRGAALTVDGVHLNERGARLVADEMLAWLLRVV